MNEMESKSMHLISSLVFLLCVTIPFSYAKHHAPSPNGFPVQLAEKLIRGLNLHPEKAVNIVDDSSSRSIAMPRIVESRFRFPNLITNGTSIGDLGHHTGYYKLPHSKAGRLFYYFFESRSRKTDPVVIWLNGGPGCSSSTGLFYENGPFHLTKKLNLVWNDYGWDKASNILYVDQPIGTGFSYTSEPSDIRDNEDDVSNDLYDFMQEFFKGHPQFAKNDFYITGESYAGHYIPAFASRIQKGNKAKEGIHINLKGLAIGNGLTDPAIQYSSYLDFALDYKLISKSNYDEILTDSRRCVKAINTCARHDEDACDDAYGICSNVFQQILYYAGDINYYDIRKKCVGDYCYDFSSVEKFLNLDSVKKALGVGNNNFVSCSTRVYNALTRDMMKNFEPLIPALLGDGIKVLIYVGDQDFICNWLGNSRWVDNMKWSGGKQYQVAKTVPFLVNHVQAGSLKSYGPLSFLKVHNAGHLVPMDQPEAALEMLKSWMDGTLHA